MSFGSWIKKASPIILTCLGAIGTAVTAIMAVKATPKAQEKKQKAKDALPEERELTTVEVIKAEAVCYIPAAVVGVGTLLCIFGANVLNIRQQASLASAYALAERTFHRYKNRVKIAFGDDVDKAMDTMVDQEEEDIQNDRPPWDEVQTFYIDHYGKFFERTMEQVQQAEYNLNRCLVLRGNASFNEFMSFLDLPPIEKSVEPRWIKNEGEWIDFEHPRRVLDDGFSVCDIVIATPPHEEDEDLPF